MSRPVDGAVGGGNAPAADADARSSSSSSSSRSSSLGLERARDAKRSIYPPRRPGCARLGFHERSELRELRRAFQRASAAMTVTAADYSSEEAALPQLGVTPQAGNVAVRLFNWHMKPRFKAGLIETAIICAIALFVCLVSAAWIRIQYHHLFHESSRADYADRAGLPLFPRCDSTACQIYMKSIEASLNHSQNPCENFYRFVCDGWKHQHRFLSVHDAAENMMYGSALSTIEWAPRDIHKPDATQSAASIVEKRVVELARSCIELSDNSLDRLKMFMVEHHLPWPMPSARDPFEILLDLSVNWNLHLWFRVSFDFTSLNVTGYPVLKIGHSAAFRTWMASMRTFAGQPRGTVQSLRYQQYVGSMLRLFGVPESQAAGIVATIEAMNLLTLTTLGPAMANPEQRFLRMSIRNLTQTMIPGISTGRLVLLLNEQFMWAHRFSSSDIVQVEDLGFLRAVLHLLGLNSETREALTLSLGLRVVHELGWMANRKIADSTLELMGLPKSLHSRRCLEQIENSVGVAWLSLFPANPKLQTFVDDVGEILTEIVKHHSRSVLVLRAQGNDSLWSLLANVLPEPTQGGFFVNWRNLMSARWRLQKHELTNVLKPGSVLRHRWSVHGTLTVSHEYFVFPLYHPDLPPSVNYGGAGRLIADEILRGVLQDPLLNESSRRHLLRPPMPSGNESPTDESPSEWSPHYVDAKALMTALSGYRLGILRHTNDTSVKESSLAQDRLFFVASCYALCSSGDYVNEMYRDASRRCNEPIMTLSEFSAAFQCKIQNRQH